MSFRHSSAVILLTVLLTVGSTAVAAQSQTDRQVTEMLEARKRSEHEIKWIMSRLSDRQKDELIRQQAVIDGILQASPDVAKHNLTEDQRQQLWNATKVIDSIIEQDRSVAEEQLRCRQERRIGSQLAKRKCRSKAEMDRDREDSRRDFDNMQQGRP